MNPGKGIVECKERSVRASGSCERYDVQARAASTLNLGERLSTFTVSWDRTGRRRQKGVEALFDDSIALACRLFHAGSIEYLHRATAVGDKPRVLHGLRSCRYRGAVGPHNV